MRGSSGGRTVPKQCRSVAERYEFWWSVEPLFVRHRKRHSSKSSAAFFRTAWTACFRTSRLCSTFLGLTQHATQFSYVSQQLDAAQRSHGFPDVWQQQPLWSRPSGAQTPPRESATALGDAPYVFAQPAAAAARGWRRAGAPADVRG